VINPEISVLRAAILNTICKLVTDGQTGHTLTSFKLICVHYVMKSQWDWQDTLTNGGLLPLVHFYAKPINRKLAQCSDHESNYWMEYYHKFRMTDGCWCDKKA